MSDFIDPENLNLDVPVDGFDSSFLEMTIKEAGYDANKEPGQRAVTPPEGTYMFRYEIPHSTELDAIFPKTKVPARWKPGVTKPNKKGEKSSFVGTSVKANMLRPAAHPTTGNKFPVTLEEFDALGLANRQFHHYLSSLFMFGRASMTDWANSILPEKLPEDLGVYDTIMTIEELFQGIPEGIATVKWTPQWKDESEEDTKKQFKQLKDIDDGLAKKFKDGTKSKAWPKEEEGNPKTYWNWNLTANREATPEEVEVPEDQRDEIVPMFVRAEIDAFLPFKAEEE